MSYPHGMIVDHAGEMIGRKTVRFHQDEIVILHRCLWTDLTANVRVGGDLAKDEIVREVWELSRILSQLELVFKSNLTPELTLNLTMYGRPLSFRRFLSSSLSNRHRES